MLPGNTIEGITPVKEMMVGVIGGGMVALLGCWEVTRRDVL